MTLKVCYLLPRLAPTESGVVVGGCAANCVGLALELKRQGVDIDLLAPISHEGVGYLGGTPLAEIIRPLPEVGVGLVGKGFGAIRALRRGLLAQLQHKNFDVVHSHSGTYPYAIVPLVAKKATCVRVHSLYCPVGADGGLYSKWWEKPFAVRSVFNRLDRVIAVTDNIRQSIETAGVTSEKVACVPMSVDTQRFCPREQKGPGRYFPAEGKAARVLFVGNASKEKGLIELLEAVRILIDRHINVFLVAAIENQSRIREYTARHDLVERHIKRLGLADHVRLLGLVDAIEDLYAESEIIVIPWNTSRGPSDYPMVALEGMAMGKCIVSTPVGGCPELSMGGRAGIIAEGFSPEHIAVAVASVANHPRVRSSVERVAAETARGFSVTTAAERLLDLYDHLLKRKVSRIG